MASRHTGMDVSSSDSISASASSIGLLFVELCGVLKERCCISEVARWLIKLGRQERGCD